MFRRDSLWVSVLVLALVWAAGAPAFAKMTRDVTRSPEPSLNSSGSFGLSLVARELRQQGLRVRLPETVLLGTPLQAGEYTISWKSHSRTATVTVSTGNDVLATVEGKLVDRGKRHNRSAIFFDTNADGKKEIREIHVSGSSQAIVFYE